MQCAVEMWQNHINHVISIHNATVYHLFFFFKKRMIIYVIWSFFRISVRRFPPAKCVQLIKYKKKHFEISTSSNASSYVLLRIRRKNFPSITRVTMQNSTAFFHFPSFILQFYGICCGMVRYLFFCMHAGIVSMSRTLSF